MLCAALASTAMMSFTALADDPVPVADLEIPEAEGEWMIGFSNYSIGNSWRQQMEADFTQAADAMKEAGINYVYQSVYELTYSCLIRLLGE